MRVILCGTAGGPFTAERASSGLVVQHGIQTIMLDCGPGALRNAMQAGILPQQIAAVVLSHLHLDHVLDLAAFVFQQRFGRWPLPVVYGPPGTSGVAGAATGFVATTPLGTPTALPSTIEIDGSDERDICGFLVHSEPTPHAPGVIAAARRLSVDGKAIVYSGDTQANPETLVPLAEGTNLLVHEVYSEEGLQRAAARLPTTAGERLYRAISSTHTEVLDAAAIAPSAGVRQLVLTHLMAYEDPAKLQARAATVFPGEILVAHDGLVVDV